jgi:hypothetical protein
MSQHQRTLDVFVDLLQIEPGSFDRETSKTGLAVGEDRDGMRNGEDH